MALNLLLLVSILLSLLSAVDFLLRRHQRRQVQSFLEDFTLRVDQIAPKELATSLSQAGTQAVIVMLTYVELIAISVFSIAVEAPMWRPGGSLSNQFGPNGYKVQLLGILITGVTLLIAWRWPLPMIMKWMLGNGHRRAILWRFLVLLVTGFAGKILYDETVQSLFLNRIAFDSSQSRLLAYFYGQLPIWPLFIVFWVVTQGVAMAAFGSFNPFLNLTKAILWRLVEYEKGSIAAIGVLLTIVLTIVKLTVA